MSEGLAFQVEKIFVSSDSNFDRAIANIFKIYELTGLQQDSELHDKLRPRTIYFMPLAGERYYRLIYEAGDKKIFKFSVMEGSSTVESIKYGFGETATTQDAYHMPLTGEKQKTGEQILDHFNASLDYIIEAMENGTIAGQI